MRRQRGIPEPRTSGVSAYLEGPAIGHYLRETSLMGCMGPLPSALKCYHHLDIDTRFWSNPLFTTATPHALNNLEQRPTHYISTVCESSNRVAFFLSSFDAGTSEPRALNAHVHTCPARRRRRRQDGGCELFGLQRPRSTITYGHSTLASLRNISTSFAFSLTRRRCLRMWHNSQTQR